MDEIPDHHGSPRGQRDRVFDVPADIGPVISATAWRDASSVIDRVVPAVITGVLVIAAHLLLAGRLESLRSLSRLQPSDWVLGGIATVIAGVIFGPDRHCSCLGKHGFSLSRMRFQWLFKSRRLLQFADVDDVETRYTRIVSDHVSWIYKQTDVWFLWLDKQGQEVFRLGGSFYEPAQRIPGDHDEKEPLDLSEVPGLDACAPAVLGFAAVEAFRRFQDQREGGPFR
jgi:hypothetical protein